MTPATLTQHINIPDLTLHRHRVDLAHVAAPIALLDIPNVKDKVAIVAVAQRNPVIPRDDMVMNGQNGFGLHFDPSSLQRKSGTT